MKLSHTQKNNQTFRGRVSAGTLVLAAVSVIAGISLGYGVAMRFGSKEVHNSDQFPMINRASSLISRRNLLVNFQPLREELQKTYEQDKNILISVYFEYLPTGANISINKDAEMWPASLIKIPVAMAAMRKIQDGGWKENNQLVILEDDKDCSYGVLCNEQTGTAMTIMEFLRASLVDSDNTAHFVLLRNINADDLENIYNHLGMDDIISALKNRPDDQTADNRMTAKRYSVFFRSLYNATFLLPDYSQEFMDLLSQSQRELLGQGLPSDILFAHKIGIRTDESIYADSGIVYVPDRPYLLTVMVQGRQGIVMGRAEADELFKKISEQVYSYVVSAK